MNSLIFILFVFSEIRKYGVMGSVGGHALFASLAQLKVLWQNEIMAAQLLEKIVGKCHNPPTAVKM